jgi:CDP-paratose 2-epimerase
VLYVDDLVNALLLARDRVDDLVGGAFNVGGGPGNSSSLLGMIQRIAELTGKRPELRFAPPRDGDQRYFVADTGRLCRAIGWSPAVSIEEGLGRLHAWFARAEASGIREREAEPARVISSRRNTVGAT